jgi:DNA primase
MCRRCSRTGDSIDLLRDQGLTFRDAQRRIGTDLNRNEHLTTTPSRDTIDQNKWGMSASQFVKQSLRTQSYDWQDTLKARHLSMETAIRFGIGWNPQDVYFFASTWGINSNRKIRIPAGLVIPTIRKNNIIGITIRCLDRVKNPKYWQIKGSTCDCLLLGKNGLPIVIVESHLDAYLIWQEAADLVSVISINGTKKGFDPYSLELIKNTSQVFVATDFDLPSTESIGAGQSAFFDIARGIPEARYLPTPIGKDPCEMVTLGVPIRHWLKSELCPSLPQIVVPSNYPGSAERLQVQLAEYPHLIPCPKSKHPWHWVYRKNCDACTGHVQCLKDVQLATR